MTRAATTDTVATPAPATATTDTTANTAAPAATDRAAVANGATKHQLQQRQIRRLQ